MIGSSLAGFSALLGKLGLRLTFESLANSYSSPRLKAMIEWDARLLILVDTIKSTRMSPELATEEEEWTDLKGLVHV